MNGPGAPVNGPGVLSVLPRHSSPTPCFGLNPPTDSEPQSVVSATHKEILTAEVTGTADVTKLDRNFPELQCGRAVRCKRRHFQLNVARH